MTQNELLQACWRIAGKPALRKRWMPSDRLVFKALRPGFYHTLRIASSAPISYSGVWRIFLDTDDFLQDLGRRQIKQRWWHHELKQSPQQASYASLELSFLDSEASPVLARWMLSLARCRDLREPDPLPPIPMELKFANRRDYQWSWQSWHQTEAALEANIH